MTLFGRIEILETRIALATVTFVWDGGGGDGRWMTGANWVGDLPPVPGSALHFPASGTEQFSTVVTNDFPAGTEFDSITVSGDGLSGYWVKGNEIALRAGVHSTGTAPASIGVPLKLTADQTFFSHGGVSAISTNSSADERPMVRDLNGYTLTLAGPGNVAVGGELIDTSAAGTGRIVFAGEGIGHIAVSGLAPGHRGPQEIIAESGTLRLSVISASTDVILKGGRIERGAPSVVIDDLLMEGGTLHRSDSGFVINGDLRMTDQSNLVFDVLAPSFFGEGAGMVTVGLVDLGGATLTADLFKRVDHGREFVVINNEGSDPVTGTFAGLPEGALFLASNPEGFRENFAQFRISYQGGDGNDVVLTAVLPQATISADGRVATYTDFDGDLVRVKTKLGQWDSRRLQLVPAGDLGGHQLALIDLGSNLPEDQGGGPLAFNFTNLKVTATPGPLGGDGRANIGAVDAGGRDLNRISIDGNLGRVLAISAGLIDVKSLGFNDLNDPPLNSLQSKVGAIGKLKVEGDVREATIRGGTIDRISVGGSLIGGEEAFSGSIELKAAIQAVRISGDIVGGSGTDSGSIICGTSARFFTPLIGIGSVFVGGSLIGGTADGSGSIRTMFLAHATIAGSIISETSEPLERDASISARKQIGSLRVLGDISAPATNPVLIAAGGLGLPAVNGTIQAIGSIEVSGSLQHANILAGYDFTTSASARFPERPVHADASIGTITVGRHWTGGTVLAGVGAGADGFVGTRDDAKLEGPKVRDHPDFFSTISAIVIHGRANGTLSAGDSFGIVAEAIGRAQIGNVSFAFIPGPHHQRDFHFIGDTGPGPNGAPRDFTIHEATS